MAAAKYLFCFAEPDFAPRQGRQHSAFVAAQLQQAQLVCRGGAGGEAVGGLPGAADGGLRGGLKRFHPLLPLPCGHTRRREEKKSRWEAGTDPRGGEGIKREGSGTSPHPGVFDSSS